ncbi:MAG: phosphoribosylformylglycinamidine synthase I [Methanomicrobiales archaeon]|nr:phosphoribosylformylglycinamidine synthase I [Methanomicrobiales archaeon]
MRFAVLQFGGSNCDLDTFHTLQDVCGVDTDLIWYKEGLQRAYDAIVVPGGFSYGDYLRAGAIAARTAIMDAVERHVREGGLFLGICNGAQIGAERGFAPGTFAINAYPKFICRWVHMRVENATSPFTCRFREGEVVRIPIAHKEGRYVAAEDVLERLNRRRQVVFRFCDAAGRVTPESNVNGSAGNITGVLNDHGNVLLMMPHPERSSEEILGSSDGRRVFESMIAYLEAPGRSVFKRA